MPTFIMAIYEDKNPGAVIGIEGGGVRVMRAASEPLEALQTRAAAQIPARILKTLYAAPEASQSDVPAPALVAPPPAPFDPWARAGIGREASRAELERMGAIPVPPERLI